MTTRMTRLLSTLRRPPRHQLLQRACWLPRRRQRCLSTPTLSLRRALCLTTARACAPSPPVCIGVHPLQTLIMTPHGGRQMPRSLPLLQLPLPLLLREPHW
jgi:hypothetical protein